MRKSGGYVGHRYPSRCAVGKLAIVFHDMSVYRVIQSSPADVPESSTTRSIHVTRLRYQYSGSALIAPTAITHSGPSIPFNRGRVSRNRNCSATMIHASDCIDVITTPVITNSGHHSQCRCVVCQRKKIAMFQTTKHHSGAYILMSRE